MNLTTIRQALADQLDAQLTGTSPRANVYAYPPSSPAGVSLLLTPSAQDGQYVTTHGTMGASALCDIGFRLEVRVDGPDEDAARAMDAYLSTGTPESIVDAIEADTTLSAAVQNVYVSGASVPARFTGSEGGREWLSASFDLIVRARRS